MSRIVSPPLHELDTLRTPLNEGEKIVLNFFLENLSEDWEIYIQPHLNGTRPDFVLLNPHVGIAIYEVKHWSFDAMHYRVEERQGKAQLWATSKEGKDFIVSDNPIEKIRHYKERLINLYAPIIGQKYQEGEKNYFAVVTAGVIFTKESTARAKDLFSLFLGANYSEKYNPIIGIDLLQAKQIDLALSVSNWGKSKYMNEEIAKQLRGWLVEPDFSRVQRQPLEIELGLNPKQRLLATTRTKSGYRRIRGAVGSGKSLVLALRAANLSAEGKNVLVISYNITLWHYLRDLIVRHKVPGSKLNNITFIHFHEWCKDIIVEGGLKSEYCKLLSQLPEKPSVRDSQYKKLAKKIFDEDTVKLANDAIDNIELNIEFGQIEEKKFDAILVDEGQDFNLFWWSTLGRLLKEGGERLLVADEAQDVYDRAVNWTDETMKKSGFTGVWNQLYTCYRTPNELIKYLRKFAEDYLPQSNIDLISSGSSSNEDCPVNLNWIQIDSEEYLPRICAKEILKIPQMQELDIVAYPDLILLMPTHILGLECVAILEKKGLRVLHIFDEYIKEQIPKKMNFFIGDARIKACTIHSFKGWESRYIVIAINRSVNLSAVYVALSRLKKHQKGSHLTVVCANPNLSNFGKTWPSFEEH